MEVVFSGPSGDHLFALLDPSEQLQTKGFSVFTKRKCFALRVTTFKLEKRHTRGGQWALRSGSSTPLNRVRCSTKVNSGLSFIALSTIAPDFVSRNIKHDPAPSPCLAGD